MPPTATSAIARGPTALQKQTKQRYFKGKPVGAERDPNSDSDSDDDAGAEDEALLKPGHGRGKNAGPGQEDADTVAGGAGRIFRPMGNGIKKGKGSGIGSGVKMELGNVQLGVVKKEPDVEEESSEEEDESDEDEPPKPAYPIIRPPGDESSEYETESESESEPEPPKPAFRPVFVRKENRNMTLEKAAEMEELKLKQEEEQREQRKNDSKEIAGETIRRELQEKEMSDLQPEVDDTDNLDPAAEFEAWRERELSRLLREKQAQAAKDEEKEEIERRRAMPEDQRLAEDLEYAEGTRNRDKTQMGFLQKYYHKGAFHGDDEILNRDYTGAVESQVDMSLLPKVMQVRDFGKASRTKYTHLADQDTSQGGWGNAHRQTMGYMGAGAGNGNGAGGLGSIGTTQTGCWNCGGPHLRKDCPNDNINDPSNQAQIGQYGASSGGYSGRDGRGDDYGERFGHHAAGASSFGDRRQDEGYSQRRPIPPRDPRGDERSRDGGYASRGTDRERERDRDRAHDRDRDYPVDERVDRHREERYRHTSRSPRRHREDERDRDRGSGRSARAEESGRERDREWERDRGDRYDRHGDKRDRDRDRDRYDPRDKRDGDGDRSKVDARDRDRDRRDRDRDRRA